MSESKKYLIGLILVASAVAFFAANKLYYIDPLSLCAIRVSSDPYLDASGVKAALRTLKRGDRDGYRAACSFVDAIRVKYAWPTCSPGDHRNDASIPNNPEELPPGCFIAGTHAIYLRPSRSNPLPTEKRAVLIGDLARLSRTFWASR